MPPEESRLGWSKKELRSFWSIFVAIQVAFLVAEITRPWGLNGVFRVALLVAIGAVVSVAVNKVIQRIQERSRS